MAIRKGLVSSSQHLHRLILVRSTTVIKMLAGLNFRSSTSRFRVRSRAAVWSQRAACR